MEKLEVTWLLATKVWWSFIWRASLFSIVTGLLLAVVLGVITVSLGYTADDVRLYNTLIGGLLGIGISIWVMKMILSKKFKGYSLAILKEPDA